MATDEEIGFPLGSTDERELLLNWLRYLRGAVLRNVDGLNDEQARWRPEQRLMPLLGIVHHLANVESRWIDGGFFGGPVAAPEDEPLEVAGLTLEVCVRAYRERGEATERAVQMLSLDTPHPYGPDVSLRWVLLHLINETARHAGTPTACANFWTARPANDRTTGVQGRAEWNQRLRLVDTLDVNQRRRADVSCWTHPVNHVRYRPAGAGDFPFLATMLGEAAVWRPDKPTPTGEQVMADPRYAMYLAGWPRQGDLGLVAEQDEPVGAAWYRTYTEAIHGHGFVAEDVPELSIAVIAIRRREGIGRRLLVELVDASVAQGHRALSLSVNANNPARGLYESVGFQDVELHASTWTMIRHAA